MANDHIREATKKIRLIDANELESRLAYQSEVRKNNMNCFGALVIDEIISNDLAASPTVDAVEVVHGRWTTRTVANWLYEEVCSVCGFCGCEEFSYCPNCGAKMDGGKDE